MKINVLLLCLACILLLTACAPATVRNGGVVMRGEPRETADFLSYYSGENIVYVTKSGEKYHTADCTYLTNTSMPVSLDQALAEGKKPCSRCHPPAEGAD